MIHQKIKPLKSLESVLSWKPSPESEMTRSTVELSDVYSREKTAAKTLVCHDMKGGYVEDRFVDGCSDTGYGFYHWQYLDIFVYFSHHLVTIPPPMWTNAAHKHGVKMLGTFITEWNDGKATCSEFLQSSRDFRGLVNKMVEIMNYYRFDGWLVNIENIIEENKVNNLKEFLAYLTERCHSEVEGSKVIWYDSVTKTGELKWQDQLNEENRMFFDVCDGIFLNYCWDESKLENSHKQAAAGRRIHDVFVGVDVFGRGCPGGGGYNTSEALSKIHKADLSAAIFAPGWVYETQEVENFTSNQNRFWRLLHEYFTTSVLSQPCLATSFCHGWGRKYFCKGEVVNDSPWYNLSLQQIQPSINMHGQRSEFKKVEFTEEDGYLGGGCLILEGQFSDQMQTVDFNLFQMHAPVTTSLYVAYTFKNPSDDDLEPVLKLTLSKSSQSRVLCLGHPGDDEDGVEVKKSKKDKEELWVNVMEKESSYQTWQNVNEWKTRCFQLDESVVCGWRIQTVGVCLTGRHVQKECSTVFYIGQIQILPVAPSISSTVQNLSCSHINAENRSIIPPDDKDSAIDLTIKGSKSGHCRDTTTVAYQLQWVDSQPNDVHYYNVYYTHSNGVPQLVHKTINQTCITRLDRNISSGKLCVQTVSTQGLVLPLEDCPCCSLPM